MVVKIEGMSHLERETEKRLSVAENVFKELDELLFAHEEEVSKRNSVKIGKSESRVI